MKHSYDLSTTDPADESVRTILRHLFGVLRAKIDGVIDDTDIEFLHDLRVANRRTRTALSQIKSVLAAPVVNAFQPEFKWIGDVTGSRRDLDVFLLAIDSCPQQLGVDDRAVVALGDFLREKRCLEHSQVCSALRSERFQDLVDGWNRFLDTGGEEGPWPPLASSPVIEVAGPRIFKAYRRIWKRGTGINGIPPAAMLHRLRIDAKKLRYLLEFFSDLYPRPTVTRFIRELKQLQDILGNFNDTVVQLSLIGEFSDHSNAQEETLAATASLAAAITERQHRLRSNFVEHFELFTNDESRKLYKATFKAG
jgi:CHAD domain-containing protein